MMTGAGNSGGNPHQDLTVLATGEPLEQAKAAVLMIHGRGATAESILALSSQFKSDGIAFLAPQAAGNSWYPNSFLEPIERNEPYLTSALEFLGGLVASVDETGIPLERIALLGFSQGACLASEFVARNARRYGGLIGFSGGLIGPSGTPRNYQGSLKGTPVFLGCSEVDFHIPVERVYETEQVLSQLGGDVETVIYPGMGHTVNHDEIKRAQRILDSLQR